MSTQGSLEDMDVASLIQQACHDQKTGRLTLRQDGLEADVYFARGNIVHAALGDSEGEEVVYKILAWQDGEF
ncbi:MAG: DUF4388 domain-containing protein, partial [Anaerolineae bacterium]